jgi:hypothetical protein
MKSLLPVFLPLLLIGCESLESYSYHQEHSVLDRGLIVGIERSDSMFFGIDFGYIVGKTFSAYAMTAVSSTADLETLIKKIAQEVDNALKDIGGEVFSPKSAFTYRIKLAGGGFRNISQKNISLSVGECVEFVELEERELVVGALTCAEFWEAHNKKLLKNRANKSTDL